MLKFIFLLIISPLFASEVKCPPESLPIEYTSPVTKNKKVTCGYMKDGKLIKHGYENEYKPEGTLIKSDYYVEGSAAEKPSESPQKVVEKPAKPVELEVIETKGPAPANPFEGMNFSPPED